MIRPWLCASRPVSWKKRNSIPRTRWTAIAAGEKKGYLSSNGRCFDIGNTVAAALNRYLKTHDPIAGSTSRFTKARICSSEESCFSRNKNGVNRPRVVVRRCRIRVWV